MIEVRQWGPKCFAVYVAYDDPRGTFIDTAETREEGFEVGQARLAEAIARDVIATRNGLPSKRGC